MVGHEAVDKAEADSFRKVIPVFANKSRGAFFLCREFAPKEFARGGISDAGLEMVLSLRCHSEREKHEKN